MVSRVFPQQCTAQDVRYSPTSFQEDFLKEENIDDLRKQFREFESDYMYHGKGPFSDAAERSSAYKFLIQQLLKNATLDEAEEIFTQGKKRNVWNCGKDRNEIKEMLARARWNFPPELEPSDPNQNDENLDKFQEMALEFLEKTEGPNKLFKA